MEKFSCPENETCVTAPSPSHNIMEKCEGHLMEKLSCPENETKVTPLPSHSIMETECLTSNIRMQLNARHNARGIVVCLNFDP